MILKNSPFQNQDKNIKDLDNSSRNHPTLEELMLRQQEITTNKSKTVHHRRDLDSLG